MIIFRLCGVFGNFFLREYEGCRVHAIQQLPLSLLTLFSTQRLLLRENTQILRTQFEQFKGPSEIKIDFFSRFTQRLMSSKRYLILTFTLSVFSISFSIFVKVLSIGHKLCVKSLGLTIYQKLSIGFLTVLMIQ